MDSERGTGEEVETQGLQASDEVEVQYDCESGGGFEILETGLGVRLIALGFARLDVPTDLTRSSQDQNGQ